MDNQAANVDVATVGAFYMPITLGAYTAWQEKTLDIEVVLKKGDNSRILKPTQEEFDFWQAHLHQ